MPAAAVRGSAKPAGLAVGAAVEADYGSEGHWYPGRIAAAHDGGTYDVDYDDGEREFGVAASAVRAAAGAAAADADAAGGDDADDDDDDDDDDLALPLPLHDLVARLADLADDPARAADYLGRAARVAAADPLYAAHASAFLQRAGELEAS